MWITSVWTYLLPSIECWSFDQWVRNLSPPVELVCFRHHGMCLCVLCYTSDSSLSLLFFSFYRQCEQERRCLAVVAMRCVSRWGWKSIRRERRKRGSKRRHGFYASCWQSVSVGSVCQPLEPPAIQTPPPTLVSRFSLLRHTSSQYSRHRSPFSKQTHSHSLLTLTHPQEEEAQQQLRPNSKV